MKITKSLLALFVLFASMQAFAAMTMTCPSMDFIKNTAPNLNYAERNKENNTFTVITMTPIYEALSTRDWYVGSSNIVADNSVNAIAIAQSNVQETYLQMNLNALVSKGYYFCVYLGSLGKSSPVVALTPVKSKAKVTLPTAVQFIKIP